jgi:hypothetical protein
MLRSITGLVTFACAHQLSFLKYDVQECFGRQCMHASKVADITTQNSRPNCNTEQYREGLQGGFLELLSSGGYNISSM